MPEGDTIHKAATRVRDAIGGRALVDAALPRATTPPPRAGVVVADVVSRGKYLLVHFEDGHVVVSHLMMTGEWRILRPDRRPPVSRLRVWLATESAAAACLDAPIAELLDEPALRRHRGLRQLGPDLCVVDLHATAWLDDVEARAARHAMRGQPIADLLLDQRVAAGIGNVYKAEICFLHGLHPATPVEQVSGEHRRDLFLTGARLLQANLDTPRRTTVEGGRPGALWVYDRTRRPCRRCQTALVTDRLGNNARVTTWCPTCQGAA